MEGPLLIGEVAGCGPPRAVLRFALGADFDLASFYRLILQGLGGAEMCADRVTAAKITLDHLVVLAVQKRTAERTGSDASHAADALLLIEFNGPGFRVAF